jgi:hypothetical protein
VKWGQLNADFVHWGIFSNTLQLMINAKNAMKGHILTFWVLLIHACHVQLEVIQTPRDVAPRVLRVIQGL